MKWYNKDKTKMIDLNAVNGYVYIPAKEYIEQNPSDTETIKDFQEKGDRIELILGGSVFIFRGDTAKELFGLVSNSDKELLKG